MGQDPCLTLGCRAKISSHILPHHLYTMGKNPHRQVDQVRVGQNKIVIPIPYTRGMSIYRKYIAI